MESGAIRDDRPMIRDDERLVEPLRELTDRLPGRREVVERLGVFIRTADDR